MKGQKICEWCYYARMRSDICQIYCTGGFENPDGTCEHFSDWEDHKKNMRKADQKAAAALSRAGRGGATCMRN